MEDLNVQKDLTNIKQPVEILKTTERSTRRNVVKICKVRWSHHTPDEATWEREDEL
jgi:hypothetical protein